MSAPTRHLTQTVVSRHLSASIRSTIAADRVPRFVQTASSLYTRRYLSFKKDDSPLEKPELSSIKDTSRFQAPVTSNPEVVVPPSLETLFPPDHPHTRIEVTSSSRTQSDAALSSSLDESSSSTPPPPPSSSSPPTGEEESSGPKAQGPPKQKSRFWFYLYQILYWSALGSLPVHLLLTKGETKDTKIKQEWKIAVLEDMRDKLRRGESIEEEEALLTVGLDRSKRDVEQVDDKYFEEMLHTAEKMDFVFTGDKEKDGQITPTSAPVVSAVPTPEPVVPRKPAPPKTEKSYL
ncbi:hypothetical protein BGZ83_007347 [Gryganskiella cystojenkinii]|nr:hypothetical protein BGZ83_007347 [Gryganskiella cystojenkinii]